LPPFGLQSHPPPPAHIASSAAGLAAAAVAARGPNFLGLFG